MFSQPTVLSSLGSSRWDEAPETLRGSYEGQESQVEQLGDDRRAGKRWWNSGEAVNWRVDEEGSAMFRGQREDRRRGDDKDAEIMRGVRDDRERNRSEARDGEVNGDDMDLEDGVVADGANLLEVDMTGGPELRAEEGQLKRGMANGLDARINGMEGGVRRSEVEGVGSPAQGVDIDADLIVESDVRLGAGPKGSRGRAVFREEEPESPEPDDPDQVGENNEGMIRKPATWRDFVGSLNRQSYERRARHSLIDRRCLAGEGFEVSAVDVVDVINARRRDAEFPRIGLADPALQVLSGVLPGLADAASAFPFSWTPALYPTMFVRQEMGPKTRRKRKDGDEEVVYYVRVWTFENRDLFFSTMYCYARAFPARLPWCLDILLHARASQAELQACLDAANIGPTNVDGLGGGWAGEFDNRGRARVCFRGWKPKLERERPYYLLYWGMSEVVDAVFRQISDTYEKWRHVVNFRAVCRQEPVTYTIKLPTIYSDGLESRRSAVVGHVEKRLIEMVTPNLNSAAGGGGMFGDYNLPPKLCSMIDEVRRLAAEAPESQCADLTDVTKTHFTEHSKTLPGVSISNAVLAGTIRNASLVRQIKGQTLNVTIGTENTIEELSGKVKDPWSDTTGPGMRAERHLKSLFYPELSMDVEDWKNQRNLIHTHVGAFVDHAPFNEARQHQNWDVNWLFLSRYLVLLDPVVITSHSRALANALAYHAALQRIWKMRDENGDIDVDLTKMREDFLECKEDLTNLERLRKPVPRGNLTTDRYDNLIGEIFIIRFGPKECHTALYMPRRDPGEFKPAPELAPQRLEVGVLSIAQEVMADTELRKRIHGSGPPRRDERLQWLHNCRKEILRRCEEIGQTQAMRDAKLKRRAHDKAVHSERNKGFNNGGARPLTKPKVLVEGKPHSSDRLKQFKDYLARGKELSQMGIDPDPERLIWTDVEAYEFRAWFMNLREGCTMTDAGGRRMREVVGGIQEMTTNIQSTLCRSWETILETVGREGLSVKKGWQLLPNSMRVGTCQTCRKGVMAMCEFAEHQCGGDGSLKILNQTQFPDLRRVIFPHDMLEHGVSEATLDTWPNLQVENLSDVLVKVRLTLPEMSKEKRAQLRSLKLWTERGLPSEEAITIRRSTAVDRLHQFMALWTGPLPLTPKLEERSVNEGGIFGKSVIAQFKNFAVWPLTVFWNNKSWYCGYHTGRRLKRGRRVHSFWELPRHCARRLIVAFASSEIPTAPWIDEDGDLEFDDDVVRSEVESNDDSSTEASSTDDGHRGTVSESREVNGC